MPRTGAKRNPVPTELESCVLAIIGQLGPSSPYAVRQYLGRSESSYWSASAGAVYPLLDRLSEAGWLTFEERAFGTRQKRTYRLTRAGQRRLKNWLSGAAIEAAAAHTYDPLRTRVFFLGMVSPEERRGFLDDAVSKTAEVLRRHRGDLEKKRSGLSLWDIRGREGAIRELAARLAWLRDIRSGRASRS